MSIIRHNTDRRKHSGLCLLLVFSLGLVVLTPPSTAVEDAEAHYTLEVWVGGVREYHSGSWEVDGNGIQCDGGGGGHLTGWYFYHCSSDQVILLPFDPSSVDPLSTQETATWGPVKAGYLLQIETTGHSQTHQGRFEFGPRSFSCAGGGAVDGEVFYLYTCPAVWPAV